MRRAVALCLMATVLVASACGPSRDGPATSTTPQSTVATSSSGTASATTTSATTVSPTSSTPTAPAATPTYLVFGWDGVERVHGARSEKLVSEPVQWATGDGVGGAVFETVAEQPGWVWLPEDADRPNRIELSNDGWLAYRLIFVLDGRPSALVSRSWNEMTRCEPEEFVEELMILDLETGDERFLMCHRGDADAGDYFTSYGGGLFSSVGWLAVGAGGTNSSLWLYDLDGGRLAFEADPFAESCAPCQLSARLSSDGSLLAYALWPTAYWQQPEPPDGDYTRAHREWYAHQQHITTEVVVMEMTTGSEVFRTEVAADARLTGFDGRFVTMTVEDDSVRDPGTGTRRLLIDIATGETREAPPAMTEPVGFWTAILASIDTDTIGYDQAQRVAGELAAEHDLTTGVVWSDGFLTLNPGYWVVFTGHFDDRDEAAAQCDAIDTACYPRYVATADTIDSELGRSMLTLEPDGLGLIQFGRPDYEVVRALERLTGSSPTDSGDEASWIEYVGWEDLGLYLGFSRPSYEHYDGVSRLIGWQYHGGSNELGLQTAQGVGVGTTTAELRAIYGEDLAIPTEPDECGGGLGLRLPGTDQGIVTVLDEAGVVQSLMAGLQVGC